MAIFAIRSVEIVVIRHSHQRYDTVGDYLWNPTTGHVKITVSDMGDWRFNIACGLHELIETALCVQDDIDEHIVSTFDRLYENKRQAFLKNYCKEVGEERLRTTEELENAFGCTCIPTMDSEPGEDRHAPYRKQHAFADGVERLLAKEMGVVWSEYSQIVVNLPYRPDDPFGENGEHSDDADG